MAWKVVRMVDTSIDTQLELHIINFLDWQREGQFSVDTQRPIILDFIANILDLLETGDFSEKILLGGETILLSDIALINETLLKRLAETADDYVQIGSWYRYLDGLLANGESYIRNLLLGRMDAQRYGIPLSPIAFMPKSYQNSAQLPQILKNFGINAVVFYSDYATIPLPFHWQAPNDASVLVINYQAWDNPQESIQAQSDSQPDGPFFWMHRSTSSETLLSNLQDGIASAKATQSTLEELVGVLRERLPDDFRPRMSGELHLEPLARTSGRFSGRIPHKQSVLALQSELNHFVEPIFALAQAFGAISFSKMQKSLLDYSWRLLMQNMAYEVFAGAVSDDVQDELAIRNRQIKDNNQAIINKSLDDLSGTRYRAEHSRQATAETYITVWNPHGYAVQQVVEIELNLPRGYYPNVLIDPDGEEQAFTWNAERNVLDFRASVASIGYAVYTLKISRDKTATYNQPRVVDGLSIGSASGVSLGFIDERLDWTFANGSISDLLSYYDGGDAGDIWQYQTPAPDVIVKGGLVDVIQTEATPTYERLIFRQRMRIAPSLTNGQRVRGLKVLDLTTTATYYNDLDGVHFKTHFTNSAEDHRLRAHIRTGVLSSVVHSDSVFGLEARTVSNNLNEYPMQSLATIYDDRRGLGLFTRGLTSFEAIKEDQQVTLALTLLRSVGWLNKKKKISATGAQLQQDLTAEFMLMPLDTPRNTAELLRNSMSYRSPLRAIQYHEKPKVNRHSYLQIDNDNVIMTALKTPENGQGIIMRLLNLAEGDSGVHIVSNEKLSEAVLLNLAEEYQGDLTMEKNQVNVSLEPNQVATVHLKF